MYIEKINQPTDVKNLNSEQLHILADEMRQALLQKLASTADTSVLISVW